MREQNTATEHQLDSDHELYILHHEPSAHFCSLPRRPLICAHGGDIEKAPPNTLSAFEAALQGGADCVEIDVSMTKDGQLVALHDRDLAALLDITSSGSTKSKSRAPSTSLNKLPFWNNRRLAATSYTSTNSPRIGDYTWDQLRKLYWEDNGPGVALVKDILDFILSSTSQDIAITLDIKLKDSVKETFEAEVMAQSVFDMIKATNCGEYCLTWAKSDLFIAAMKNLDHRQRVGLVVLNETSAARTAGMHEPLRLPHLGVDAAGVHYRMATAELTALLKKAKRKVYYWTANTAAMMTTVLDAGPDAVVTSYPRKLVKALQTRAVACAREKRLTSSS